MYKSSKMSWNHHVWCLGFFFLFYFFQKHFILLTLLGRGIRFWKMLPSVVKAFCLNCVIGIHWAIALAEPVQYR